jgi:epoxyqueuosine reductase
MTPAILAGMNDPQHIAAVTTEGVVALGLARGCDRVGVCNVEPFESVFRSLVERTSQGLSGGLGFTFTDPDLATDLRRSFPWALRLVVAGRAYLPAAGSPGEARGTAKVARFAVDDAYAPLRSTLEAIASALALGGHRAEILMDDARLVDRAAAVRAGLGWWGKNTMVLSPGQGPWMLFGSVVTDAPLDVTQPMDRGCGSCQACLPACPTGALVAPGILDVRLCLAAVLQSPGVIPPGLRTAVADRLYGCDDCLEACPPARMLLESASGGRGRHDLGWLLSTPDETLAEAFGHFYLARSAVTMLRRNALVVAGNSGDHDLVPIVIGFLGHPDPVLRLHAVWAARALAPSWIEELLNDRRTVETDGRVQAELDWFGPGRSDPAVTGGASPR